MQQTVANIIIPPYACVAVLLQSMLVAGGLLILCLLTVRAQAGGTGCGPKDMQPPVPVFSLCANNAACPSPSCKCEMSYSCEFGIQYFDMTQKCLSECQRFAYLCDLCGAPMPRLLHVILKQ